MPARTAADPVALLKEDHAKVKRLFDEFEQATNKRSQGRIAREAILELDVHAGIEEEIFYPAFAEAAADQDIVLEAEEEHHVVHLLIAELRNMSESDEHFQAKFTVLAENVRHHIGEEEKEMLPKAKRVLGKRMEELGQEMTRRKRELLRQFKSEASAARVR